MLNPNRLLEQPPPEIFHPMSAVALNAKFDDQCMSIATRRDLSLPAKLDQLEIKLQDIDRLLLALLEQKTIAASLRTHLNHALTLLDAIQENETRIRRPEYISQLIESHRESVTYLIDHSPDAQKEEWTERLEQLRNPGMGRRVTAQVTTLLSPTAWLFRALAPTALRQTLNDTFPTLDSETLGFFKTFVLSHITRLTGPAALLPTPPLHMRGELGETNRIIEDISNQLAERNVALKSQFIYATQNTLEQLQKTTHKMIPFIQEYKIRSHRVTANQESLREITLLDAALDNFITKNNGFFVKLSLFLSKISHIFKTNTARKVEKSQSMKMQLKTTKVYYEQAIEADKINMEKPRRGVSRALKETLQTSFRQEEVLPAPGVPPIAFARFYTVETMFNDIKRKEAAAFTEEEASPFPLRH